MADPTPTCIKMVDALFTSEIYLPVGAAKITEPGRLSERWKTQRAADLADSGQLAESWYHRTGDAWADALVVGEKWSPRAAPVAWLHEAARVADTWRPRQPTAWADTGQLAERWEGMRRAMLRDSMTAAEQWTPVRAMAVTLADRLHAGEAWSHRRTDRWDDAARWGERWHGARQATLADSLRAGDTWGAQGRPIVVLRDQARLGERWTTQLQPLAKLADEVFVDERWLFADPATDAWTANTDTWGTSRYEDWPVNSLAEVDGVLYGATDAGLVRLDADDDAGAAIAARLTTGLHDLAGEANIHPRTLYAGATVDGQLQATVYHVTGRTPAEHTYTFEARPAADFAPQRVRLGRGIKSRYMQFTIANVAGADFTIDTLSLLGDPTTRRV